jgi:hypothetical protein
MRLPRPLALRWAALSLAVVLGGCASHTQVAPEVRARVERDLTGRDSTKFLKLSYFVTPFFGDASKRLLTAVPPDEVRLLNHPDGRPVNPGPVEKILPAGRKVRITRVEFPTSWVVMERIPYTPRHQPWVYLEVEDEPKGQTFILPISPELTNHDDLVAEVGRFLADQDPSGILEAFSDSVRDAVRTKTAVTDMPKEALQMAWGYPELIRKDRDGDQLKETWVYPGRKRIAHVVDGRLVKTEVGAQ